VYRRANIALGVEGVRIHEQFVPLAANIISADVRTRPGVGLYLRSEQATIPAGTALEIELMQPVSTASLIHASQMSAVGGGPNCH
jgi:hypothetical protein